MNRKQVPSWSVFIYGSRAIAVGAIVMRDASQQSPLGLANLSGVFGCLVSIAGSLIPPTAGWWVVNPGVGLHNNKAVRQCWVLDKRGQ